jgi:hypothetical protein
VPGATVKATQGDRILLTVTDENGAFRVDGITAGQWNVEVSMFGFEAARKEVNVAAAGTKTDFTLNLRERARAFDRNQAQVENADTAAMPPPEPTPISADSANESLMVSGSISGGLQTTAQDMRDFGGFGPGGRGGFGPGGFGEGGIPGAAAAMAQASVDLAAEAQADPVDPVVVAQADRADPVDLVDAADRAADLQAVDRAVVAAAVHPAVAVVDAADRVAAGRAVDVPEQPAGAVRMEPSSATARGAASSRSAFRRSTLSAIPRWTRNRSL